MSPLRYVFLVAALAACSGEDFEEREPVCQAKTFAACECPSGASSMKACADDGSKWEACECSGTDASPCIEDSDCRNGFFCNEASECEELRVVGPGGNCSEHGTACETGYVCNGGNCIIG